MPVILTIAEVCDVWMRAMGSQFIELRIDVMRRLATL
jgi:hypothetical protein